MDFSDVVEDVGYYTAVAALNVKYWLIPGVFTDLLLSDLYYEDMDVGFDGGEIEATIPWTFVKTCIISPAILFGAVMGGIYGANHSKINQLQDAFTKQTAQTVEVIRSNVNSACTNGTNAEPLTITVDTENGKISGILVYEGIDKDGDKARYLAKYEADVDKAKLGAYTVNMDDYENAMQKVAPNIKSLKLAENDVNYWSTAGAQKEVVKAYAEATESIITSFDSVIQSSSNYTVESVGKAYDMSQSLLKNALYTNPTLISDTSGYTVGIFTAGKVSTELVTNGTVLLDVSDVTKGSEEGTTKFYVRYLEKSGKGSEFKESKVVVNTKDYDPSKCSITEYTYDQFMKGTNVSFSENMVTQSQATQDSIIVM